MTDRNRPYQNERVSTHSDVQCGSANRQTSFSGHIANKFRRPTILQLNIEGLTASKINVLHHLAMQSEALVILLQETHCTDAEKLVFPNYQLAGSSLSRKHGLATFVHERLRYTLLDQSPLTSEIEWLCVDVDGYKIVSVYKPPPTRLQTLDLPVFPHSCLYAGDFNCRHADWGYYDNSPDGECLAGWASINCLALLYNAKDAASFYSGRWNTGTNPDLPFASVGPNSRLPDRRVWHRGLCKLLRLLPDKHMVKMIMELIRNRSFTLTTGDSKQSRLRRLKNGVPQGSVLAPLLFNIYTYDLPSMISRKFAYADDLALLHSSGNWNDLEGTLSQDMSTLSAISRLGG